MKLSALTLVYKFKKSKAKIHDIRGEHCIYNPNGIPRGSV